MIECNKYYNHYKDNVDVKEDKSTHINLFNIGAAFTKDLNFFKGMACIFGAYCCHSGVFPFLLDLNISKMELKK